MQALFGNLKELVEDPKHLSARFLKKLAKLAGVTKDFAALFLVGLFSTLLAFSPIGGALSRSILVSSAIIFSRLPKETPKNEHLLLFWVWFGISTLVDSSLEAEVPLYYLLKTSFAATLFLKPFRLIEHFHVALFQLADEAPVTIHLSDTDDKNWTLSVVDTSFDAPTPSMVEHDARFDQMFDSFYGEMRPMETAVEHSDSTTAVAGSENEEYRRLSFEM